MMFDVICVTYASMMTVSTHKVCTPPRYVTIPVLLCIRAVPVFLENYDDVSAISPNLVPCTYPLNCVVFVSHSIYYILMI